jgi:hypothetical protein
MRPPRTVIGELARAASPIGMRPTFSDMTAQSEVADSWLRVESLAVSEERSAAKMFRMRGIVT